MTDQETLAIASKRFEDIESSEEFKWLDKYARKIREDFNVFKIMGVQGKELVHSRILANLLNPEFPHGLGNAFLKGFLRALGDAKKGEISTVNETCIFSVGQPMSISPEIAGSKVLIEPEYKLTEQERIDLLIIFPDKKITIGIENKIWAWEGKNQLKRYQSTMEKKFNSSRNAIVFLTPYGKKPNTAELNSPVVTVYGMSYGQIIRIVKESIRNAGALKEAVSFFLDQFSSHLENDMIGTEAKEKCWGLFNKYEQAYRFMADNIKYCEWRKIKIFFDTITNKLKEDERFSKWKESFDITTSKDKEEYDEKECRFAINVRSKNWPEDICLLIYKYWWLGIYPYTCNAEIASRYIASPQKVQNRDRYFFSNDGKISDENDPYNPRIIRRDGNSFAEDDIKTILERAAVFLKKIEEILRAKGWDG